MIETVIVIGGGIVGYATALHLELADPELDVLIFERDLTYATAATGKGTGGFFSYSPDRKILRCRSTRCKF
ncbi:hypothetical protein GCM10023190_24240 [Enteractinococcus fodinae]|uniref:Glycine/D-amino acid oxidase-like deaminating enzyme n=1 Tax=Enteractinococcus fodinae TaxID=684663 RepID=A0ABU2B2K0_9MICC|nr:FAD-dependent oxidoreductase [Enteractinococcus fodinae]MDR7347811.1 glycine/D-amino acid oxidase-like deaminating enzyme [Enteractinococcus fodinae]